METVARALRRSGSMGEPLPDVYQTLAEAQIKFRRGGTSILAGWPGAFKSTFAINCLVRWAKDPAFVALYISADSDNFTVAKRCSSIITGDPMTLVEETLREGSYAKPLRTLSNVHWEFRPLNIQQLDERLVALNQMHGKMPDLVVIDNLMNVVSNPTDYSGQMTMCRDLDTVSRAAGSHVMILHHTHELSQNTKMPAAPQAVWELHGRVAQFPRLILTLAAQANPEQDKSHLMLACVKNTNGPADRTGRTYEDFIINTPNAQITEIGHAA